MNSDNLVNLTLGNRYEILDKIGTGGMATVYKAKDNLLNRFVAIKVLRDSLEGEKQVVTNFIREAQSSASLAHSNIVSVFDVGEEENLNYMVMEYVDGITLKAYIKERGVLPWQEACDFAIQIGQGINEAHLQNIIHRDIKPQNILLTKDKVLKVTDFGIAKAVASETTVVGGTALGSVHYISPEQARGGFTDVRSDIYSLGIVLYEMLTGKVPFDGDTAVGVALMHLEKEPVNVRCVNIEIPADLAYVTMKAISKEQHGRYQNVQELLADLHAVLADEPLPSRESMFDCEDDFGDDLGGTHKIEIPEEPSVIVTEESRGRTNRKKEKKKKSAAQKKADRTASVLAISTVAVIILIVLGAFFFMTTSKESLVPDLSNMTVEEATNALKDVSLKLSEEIEYSLSDTVEENRVILQDPLAKTLIKKGEAVKVIVSIGASGGNIPVPDVSGKTSEEAIMEIIDAGLNYMVIEETSVLVEAGKVIRQTPIAGTRLNTDDTVTLHISKGNVKEENENVGRVSVPSLIGLSKDQAEASLAANGLNLGTTTRKASAAAEGTVISYSPSLGKMVAKGSFVSIVLSSGNESSTQTVAEQQAQEQAVPEHETEPEGVNEDNGSAGTNTSSNEGSSQSGESGSSGGSSTKTFTVKIPEAANDNVEVEIVADGRTAYSGVHSKEEGSVSVQIKGSGSMSVQAYIDGAKVSDKVIEFN